MKEDERTLMLAWAQKAQEITSRDELTSGEKLRQLNELETTPAIKVLVVAVANALKQNLWDDRSWPARGALSGLALGVVALGGQGAGIAAMGGAIGVPLFLLTTAGGALLATIISEVNGSDSKNKK